MQNNSSYFFEKMSCDTLRNIYEYCDSSDLVQQYKVVSNVFSRRAILLVLCSRTDRNSIALQHQLFKTWHYYPQLTYDYDSKASVYVQNEAFLSAFSVCVQTAALFPNSSLFHQIILLSVLGKMKHIRWEIDNNLLDTFLKYYDNQKHQIRNILGAIRPHVSSSQRAYCIKTLQSHIDGAIRARDQSTYLRAWALLDIFAPDLDRNSRVEWINKFCKDLKSETGAVGSSDIFKYIETIPVLLSYFDEAQFKKMMDVLPSKIESYSIPTIQNILRCVDRRVIQNWIDQLIQDVALQMSMEAIQYLSICKCEISTPQWSRLLEILKKADSAGLTVPDVFWEMNLENVDQGLFNQAIEDYPLPENAEFFNSFLGKMLRFMPEKQKVTNLLSSKNFNSLFDCIFYELRSYNKDKDKRWLSSLHYFIPHLSKDKKQKLFTVLLAKFYQTPEISNQILEVLAPYAIFYI